MPRILFKFLLLGFIITVPGILNADPFDPNVSIYKYGPAYNGACGQNGNPAEYYSYYNDSNERQENVCGTISYQYIDEFQYESWQCNLTEVSNWPNGSYYTSNCGWKTCTFGGKTQCVCALVKNPGFDPCNAFWGGMMHGPDQCMNPLELDRFFPENLRPTTGYKPGTYTETTVYDNQTRRVTIKYKNVAGGCNVQFDNYTCVKDYYLIGTKRVDFPSDLCASEHQTDLNGCYNEADDTLINSGLGNGNNLGDCYKCPCMPDKDGVSRCGVTDTAGATSRSACYINNPDWIFHAGGGDYKIKNQCNAL